MLGNFRYSNPTKLYFGEEAVKSLPQRGLFAEDRDRCQSGGDRYQSDHNAGENGAGVEDAILFSEEIDDRLEKAEQKQRQQRFAPQAAVAQRRQPQQAHQQEGQQKAMAQQKDDRRGIQPHSGGHEA